MDLWQQELRSNSTEMSKLQQYFRYPFNIEQCKPNNKRHPNYLTNLFPQMKLIHINKISVSDKKIIFSIYLNCILSKRPERRARKVVHLLLNRSCLLTDNKVYWY